jgi:succinate dehydrogenase flavin-adding protein (antitoxin of CptAB toxin-antitoxin module)
MSKGIFKKQIKQIDKALSFYIDKSNKTKDETAYMHELLHKRHDLMLENFYARKQYEKYLPAGVKVLDIILNKPFFANKYLKSMDDSAPDAFILLQDSHGNQLVVVHELKCGRSNRMVAKAVSQLDKYAREVSKTYSNIICMLTYGKRTKLVDLDFLDKMPQHGFFDGVKGAEV